MKTFTSESQKIGKKGEDIACAYLIKNGFTVVDRNFSCLRGEIDIIAQKKETTYFIEVKSSVTHETSNNGGGVSYETISPEENFHQYKAQKFLKTVQYYLYTMGKENSSVQIDLITVRINDTKNEAKIKRYENVV